ncbi:hypothetical protein [Rathayibacter toxicus]|uniref:Aldolase n=1 Tax=Rathayibacter toxicus TaxID=145458 RepID=A0A0U1PTX8_9MICO|nr:hypothetical protein [Rathayibacter toxicus]ALS57069.1 hypothetical protein APU90_04220 [Rathayibacter toxicus]KKM46106.1 hypothetical protein VT73_03265 [Rathayibacter toxicus]PPG23058.1 aldolase [Rathayibacter toxicus]PPG47640.1 aldolase [Rathayibacter toxicus]PPH24779.1 aldolase [Rathayibacter toxicus]
MTAITLLDCTLRDGGNHNSWQFTPQDVDEIVTRLDRAGVPFIEIGYRGGSGSHSAMNTGASARCDDEYLAALPAVTQAAFVAMVVPTVCSLKDALHLAHSRVKVVRVAVYPWDAHLAPAYIEALRAAGLRVTVNLMALSYTDQDSLHRIVGMFTGDAAPDVFYVADSFGALTPRTVTSVITQLVGSSSAPVGVHFHNNLGLSAANTLAAIDAGARWVDASLASLARGAGNLATEQATAICEAAGIAVGDISSEAVADAAEYVLRNVLDGPLYTSRSELLSGLNNHHYYFQKHINEIAADLDLNVRELGRRVGCARPKKVTRELVLEMAHAVKAEERNT